ncbi:hypothetical protein HDV05_007669 [Chytridiales sp. JEL 0842]|nr:hypothetical protein HDV05_007669 [Chytridiales sp. JEL 0842]
MAELNSTITDPLGNTTETTAEPETTTDSNLWFTPIAANFAVGINSVSLFFSVVNLIIILVGSRYKPTVFKRLSLKIIFGMQVVNALYHANYILSMYLTSYTACKVTTMMFVFFTILEIGLTTCIGFNIFMIAVLRKNLPPYALLLYWLCSTFLALCFSVPAVSIDNLFGYDPEMGCWFVGPESKKYLWIFYYGPILGLAVLNLVMAISIYATLKAHQKNLISFGRKGGQTTKDSDESGGSENMSQAGTTQHIESGMMSSSLNAGSSVNGKSGTHESSGGGRRQNGQNPLIAAAMQVNVYLVIPFVVLLWECINDSREDLQQYEVSMFFTNLSDSLIGFVTFLVFCWDTLFKMGVWTGKSKKLQNL